MFVIYGIAHTEVIIKAIRKFAIMWCAGLVPYQSAMPGSI